MEFSEDIIELVAERYPGVDLSNLDSMSLDELETLKDSVADLRQEFFLLEMAFKTLGNAAYGSAANCHFYFYNVRLAGDITGECRNLTKTMWHNLEELFHHDIWDRNHDWSYFGIDDLWKEFNFELDESKHEWYLEQPISIYSDTDSLDENSMLIIKRNGELCKMSFKDLWNLTVETEKTYNMGHQDKMMCMSTDEILNWTKEKGLHFVPIKYIMKHKVSKSRFKIKTKSGKEIIVTGDHSCIVFRNGEQSTIKAKDINKDTDKILSALSISKFIFEEIDTIEQLTDFDDDYVYDVEVDDDSHTFIGNDILVHNSVYTTMGTFFDAMTPESKARYDTDRKKLDFILDFHKRFVDKQNNKWCDEIYNPRHGHNVHEFELETVSKAGIYLKKKKYLKALVYSKGNYYDKPKLSGTGIEIIKSTTPALCRTMLKELMQILMFEASDMSQDEFIYMFNDKLREYKKQFYSAETEQISQSVGIGDYNKYVIDDKDMLKLKSGCPVSVQAIARYNQLAHIHGQDNLVTYSGKIKYYNIRTGAKADSIGYFGFPAGNLPEWAPKVDMQTQWVKNIVDPINRFLEVMKIPLIDASGTIQLTLF